MDLVRSDDLSLKYQRFTFSGCKDIDIRKFEFLAKTQFLYVDISCNNDQNYSVDLEHNSVIYYRKLLCI